MTDITSDTPTGVSSNPDVTVYDEGLPLPNGAVLNSIGVYSSSAMNGSVKVIRKDSAASSSIVYSQDFSHLGNGWQDVSVSYTIPSTGNHFVGSWLANSAPTNPNRLRAYHYNGAYGNRPVGDYPSGWSFDTGNLRGMRATYNGLPPPPTGDNQWYDEGTFKYRATGVPDVIVLFHSAWDDNYTQIDTCPQFETIQDCVLLSVGEPNAGPDQGGSSVQLAKIKDAIDFVKTEWGNLPIVAVAVSGGAYVIPMFMAAYPEEIQAASLWLGIYDLDKWYADYPGERTVLENICGGTPTTVPNEYKRRSPRWVMDTIHSVSVIINSASGDTVVPAQNQIRMYHRFKGLPGCTATFYDIGGNHRWTSTEINEAVNQVEELAVLV